MNQQDSIKSIAFILLYSKSTQLGKLRLECEWNTMSQKYIENDDDDDVLYLKIVNVMLLKILIFRGAETIV